MSTLKIHQHLFLRQQRVEFLKSQHIIHNIQYKHNDYLIIIKSLK